MPSFDCFLSHNGKDKPAVRTLKHALEERHGLRLWLDEEQLRPGLPWQSLLEQAIQGSKSVAVCLAADGIGPWEDEEMQAALRLAVRDGRPVIPVLLPGAPERPDLPLFLGNRTWVDLRGGLGESQDGAPDDGPLGRLVWGITGQTPAERSAGAGSKSGSARGAQPSPPGGPPAGPPPIPSETVFLDEVFDLLDTHATLILLAQADRELGGTLEALRRRAVARFGAARVLHLSPPRNPQASESEFFATLGKRAAMDPPPGSALEFESRLDDRLRAGERLFLLVSGLGCPSCSDSGRERLADVLRGLSEHHGDALRLVLVGAEGLAALKFAQGDLSLLSHAEPRHWPEWNTGDLMDRARRLDPPLALAPDEALTILAAGGGHPRLILDALRCRARGRPIEDCVGAFERSGQIEAQLNAIAQDPHQRRALAVWLAQADLGAYRHWIRDPLLRRLYWLDLLRADGPAGEERLVWRCGAVVRVGLNERGA